MNKKVVEFLQTGRKEYNECGYVETIAVCSLLINGEQSDIELYDTIDGYMENELNLKRRSSGINYVKDLNASGHLIMEYLRNTGAEYIREKYIEEVGGYTAVISDGKIYQIKILVNAKPRRFVNFYDIDKVVPLKIKDINSGFDLNVQEYMEDDIYNKENIEILKSNTFEYVKLMQHMIDMDLDGMTLSSKAFSLLKKSVKRYRFKYKMTAEDEYDFIHPAYHAGYNDINPIHQGKDLGDVISMDVNSMFPSILRNGLLPYGEGVYFKGKWKPSKVFPLAIQKIKFSQAIAKHDKVAMLNPYEGVMKSMGKYIREIDIPMEIVLSNVLLETFLENYYVYDLEYVDGYKYSAKTGSFKDFVDQWMETKVLADRDGDVAMRTISKMVMNYSYGGFGKRKERTTTYMEGDEEVIVKTEARNRYLPIAIFITSYAIKEIVDIRNSVGDRFIYADVDSVHLIGHEIPEIIKDKIHQDKLGYWAIDGKFNRARFLKLKTYIEQNDEKTVIRTSGAGDEVKEQITFDNFNYGSEFDGMIRTRRVKGGSIKEIYTYKL